MSFRFSARSLAALASVHPDLVRVMHRALELSPLDFVVTEGLRTPDRQKLLYAQGASKTLNSRHLPHPSDGLSRAVDLAPWLGGQIRWDWPLFHQLAAAVKQATQELGVAII